MKNKKQVFKFHFQATNSLAVNWKRQLIFSCTQLENKNYKFLFLAFISKG